MLTLADLEDSVIDDQVMINKDPAQFKMARNEDHLCWKSNCATVTGSVLVEPTRLQQFELHSQSLPL